MLNFRCLAPIALTTSLFGAELNIQKEPFFILHDIPATVLPLEHAQIRLDPEEWQDFEIIEIRKHASLVKKEDVLLSFRSEDLDKETSDLATALSLKKLQLQKAETDLATLEKSNPERLARLRRDAKTTAEELTYFTETSRKSSEESAALSLKKREQRLASVQEELKQLRQMYEADDITEDTEEIILQQQINKVEYAKFDVHMEKLNYKRSLEVSIPRKAISLTESRDDSALAFEVGEKAIPLSLELKKIEVANLKTELSRATETLEKLKLDRNFMEIKASADGTFYFGSIDQGKWNTGELVKNLKIGGNPPLGKTVATLIPATTQLNAIAFLDQPTAMALKTGAGGTASLDGSPEINFPVKLRNIAPSPGINQKYQAAFEVTWPDELRGTPGQTLRIQIISYATEDAITVPTAALTFGPKGWTAEAKLADGKTEQRPITRGKSSDKETEITSGLEEGQVVIVP